MAAASTPAPSAPPQSQPTPPKTKPRWEWMKYATPILVLLLAAAVIITITRNWNAWEGGRVEPALFEVLRCRTFSGCIAGISWSNFRTTTTRRKWPRPRPPCKRPQRPSKTIEDNGSYRIPGFNERLRE